MNTKGGIVAPMLRGYQPVCAWFGVGVCVVAGKRGWCGVVFVVLCCVGNRKRYVEGT